MKDEFIIPIQNYIAFYYTFSNNLIRESSVDYELHFENISQIMHQEQSEFKNLMIDIIDSKNMKDSQVYHQANLTKSAFNRYKNGSRIPDHQSILKLMIGMQCNIKQAKSLMDALGYSFSTSSKTDLIIRYFIENEYYNVMDIDSILVKFGEETLFSIQ